MNIDIQAKAASFNGWLASEMTVQACENRTQRMKVCAIWTELWLKNDAPESWLIDKRNIEFWDLYEAEHGESDRIEIPKLALAFKALKQGEAA